MRASIRRYIVVKGREDAAIKHAQDGVLPMLARQPGFVAYYFINIGDGEMLAVSVFETQEGAEGANELAKEYITKHLPDVLRRTMMLEGEVVVHS